MVECRGLLNLRIARYHGFESQPLRSMREVHPFEAFVPKETKYLFLGTFVTKIDDPSFDWYFASKRNQYWTIMSEVYGRELKTKEQKQKLFTDLKMAITDVIISCERSKGTNADNNLVNIEFNTAVIEKIIVEKRPEKIFFSSREAEKLFKKGWKRVMEKYPEIELVTLPSSSPRYASMSRQDKVTRYNELLPKIEK